MSQSKGIEVNWSVVRLILALPFIAAGLFILGLSVYGFLRVGEWGTPSVVDAAVALDGADGNISAFFNGWVGLTRILDYIPLWLALTAAGVSVAVSE